MRNDFQTSMSFYSNAELLKQITIRQESLIRAERQRDNDERAIEDLTKEYKRREAEHDFTEFRKTTWTTADGIRYKIFQLSNEHLINIIWYIAKHIHLYNETLFNNFLKEAEFRKLPWSAPTPYEYKK